MRVALYARFSSELQDDRSISDQFALAEKYVREKGWKVTATFSDAAISGNSILNRPEFLKLCAHAQARQFEVVLAESLDRLSRNQADIARLYEQFVYFGVQLWTIADGEVSEIHIGLKGTMNALYIKDLAQKTRRGQIGRVKAGRIPGGRSYGYDVIRDGEERGRRLINEREAEVIRRIFADYAAGVTPMAIVQQLNAGGIPGPRGGPWNVSTLVGSAKRHNGILANSLYAGRITYNRQRFLKDPATGRRQARANAAEHWVTSDVPDLAIVDAATWDAAQTRRARTARTQGHHRKPRHLLSGLLECGTCGGNMIVRNRFRGVTYFGCSKYLNRRGCSNTRSVPAHDLEDRILKGLKRLLLEPAAVEAAVTAYQQERARLAREQEKQRADISRELTSIQASSARILEAIRVGGGDVKTLVSELRRLEERQEQLVHLRDSKGGEVVTLHPHAAKRYRQLVHDLNAALSEDDPDAARSIALFRRLVRKVRVLQTGPRQPVGLEIEGDLAALLKVGNDDEPSGVGEDTSSWPTITLRI